MGASWTDTKFTKEETGKYLSMITLPYRHQHERAKTQPQELIVSYFFKPKTKFPPRLYLLFGHWPERNRRAAGISKQPCLYTRRIGKIEREEINDCGRMMSCQFEAHQIDKLIWRHMEDGLTDREIEAMLSAVLPACTPEFRNHTPVTEMRKRFDIPY